MATDPEISLGVRGGATGPMQAGYTGSTPPNALALLGSVTDTRAKLLGLQARQRAGEILAAAPDLDTGIARLQQDPLTAAWAPELAQTAAATRNAVLSGQGQLQQQGIDAFHSFAQNLPAVLADPKNRPPARDIALRLASPAVRDRLGQSIDYLYQSLDHDLPQDPAAAKQRQVQDLAGWIVSAGAGAAVPQILGAPAQVQAGNRIEFGRVAPAQGGPGGEAPGALSPGNALVPGIAPQYAQPGAVAQPGIGPRGPAGPSPAPGAGPSPNALGVPAPGLAGPLAPPNSVDGGPLVPPGYVPRVPGRKPGVVGGVPIGPAGEIASGLAHDFMTEGLRTFRNATASMPMLDEIDANLDNMAKLDPGQKTNFMTPGAAGDLRTSLGNGLNTVLQMFGDKTAVDPSKLASAEDLMKVTQRMGPSVLQSLLGQQREAAETIKNMNEKGVPGINNTYLGGKLMTASIRQATKRVIDMRNFENWWQAQTGGDLTGAEEEFNRLRPAQSYIKQALDEFGLTPLGFKSLGALRDAVAKGYLTPKQAADQAKKQGFKLGAQ